MKKLVVGLVLTVAAVGLVYLVNAGIIRWQPLTILAAAIAAPFKFLMGLLGSEGKIRKAHREKRRRELEFQEELESRIGQREERVATLYNEIEALNARLTELQTQKETLAAEIEKLSAEKKQQLGKNLLGD